MARLESVAIAGYYPTPPHLVPAIAARLDPAAAHQATYDPQMRVTSYPTYALLDPAAGDGAALVACAHVLFGEPFPALGQGPQVRFYGIELEAERAQALTARVRACGPAAYRSTTLHSDAFATSWTTGPGAAGAQLLLLNPPYDLDPMHGRLEQAFLTRFTPALTPGTGLLVFIVPGYALAASAAYLATEYEACHCYRFPDPDFAAYRQVVLLARRRSAPLRLPGATDRLTAQITAWSDDPLALPILPSAGTAPPDLALSPGATGGFVTFQAHPLDVQQILSAYRPWMVGAGDLAPAAGEPSAPGTPNSTNILTPLVELGLHLPLTGFLRRQLPVAMPPKPAYLALLLASGLLNGLRVAPDNPQAGWPPLLVKGRFKKDFVTVKEHQDKKGRTTSQVQVQQPTLAVCILALTDPPRYADLKPGTTPSGATTVDDMNVADLLAHYGQGLAALMRAQFPAQHDPTNPAHLVPLPPLARALYTAQAHVVQSTLKLLGTGAHPFILGEVGTGKSSQALAVAAALAPTQFATTRAALRTQGHWTARHAPRPVRRVVIMCPPHLLEGWTEQVRLTLPGAGVVRVQRPGDLHAPPPPAGTGPGADLTIYLLSRETAKLGHAWQAGLATGGTCPRCGAPVGESPERIVAKRLRCRHQPLVARHPAGALAQDLARLLLPTDPVDDLLCALVPARWLRRAAGVADEPSPEDDAVEEATRQATWTAQASRPALLRLLEQFTQTIYQTVVAAANPPADQLAGLLRAALLLHLAAPPAQQSALVSQTVAMLSVLVHPDGPPRGMDGTLRDGLLRLLLLLAPAEAPNLTALEAALVAGTTPGSSYSGECYTRTRARLADEARWAAQVAADQLTVVEARERAVQRATRAPGPDWYEFTRSLDTGVLTWREGGSAYSASSVAAARRALDLLIEAGQFIPGPPCNEPLYAAVPQPRRVPLARYIARHARRHFDLVILDEMHEFNNVGSAQEQAAHLLAALPRTPVLGLTGSLMGGYSSSLFANFRAFSPAFRAEFGPHDKGKFVARFGYLKILKTLPDKATPTEVREYGKASLRAERDEDPLIRILGEAPGVLPLFLPQYLLPQASIIHKTDLATALPPLHEQPVALAVAPDDADGQELLRRYATLQEALLTRIAADRFSPLQGRLLGALTELPSFLDLATADVGNARDATGQPVYEVRYSANCGDASNSLVAGVELLPAGTLLPKERWLLELVREQLTAGGNVLVFVRHTGQARLVARYQRLLRTRLGVEVVYLDSAKVETKGREDWLKREVIGRHRRVLLVNPEAIKTGLNCLTPYFTTAIWMELTYNALTYRQANGRIHRLGSNPATEIEVYVPVYAGTAQETALALVARKVTVSTQMDGLEVESQLEAAGAGDSAGAALEVLSMGQALYEILSGQAPAPQQVVPVPQQVVPASQVVSRPAAPDPARQPLAFPPAAEHPGAGERPQQLALFDPAPVATTERRPSGSPPAPPERPQQMSLFDLFPAA